MRLFWKPFGILLAVIFFIALGCTLSNDKSGQHEWMYPNGKLKVLCTTAMCADLVMAVGGQHIDCITLIQGESDPHSYQLVKGDDEKFARADTIFYNGLGLEHGPSLSHMLENSPKAHALGDYIRSAHPEAILFVGNTVDPHIWMDVGLWKEAIEYVAEVLAKAISTKGDAKEGELQQNSEKLQASYAAVHAEILARMHTISESERYLVTTHDAFNYFARAYLSDANLNENWRLRAQAPEGLAPDSQLSTADIRRLVDHIVQYHIKVVFPEANVNRDSLKKLVDSVQRTGYSVRIASNPLYADSLGEKGGAAGTYLDMMRYDAETIAEAF